MSNIFASLFLTDEQRTEVFNEALDKRIDEILDMTEEQAQFFADGALTIIGIQSEVTRQILAENAKAVQSGDMYAADAEYVQETFRTFANRADEYVVDVRNATFDVRGIDAEEADKAIADVSALADSLDSLESLEDLLGGLLNALASEAERREETRAYAGV